MKERRTRQLTAIFDVVRQAYDHPTAEDVFRRVQQRLPRVSLSTVYRNLQKLVQSERIGFVSIPNQANRYDARIDRHDHFLCLSCCSLSDLYPRAEVMVTKLDAEGYRVDSHALTLYGACPSCSQRQ